MFAAEWLPLLHPSVLNPEDEASIARLALQLEKHRLSFKAREAVEAGDPELERLRLLQNPVARSNIALLDLAVVQAAAAELSADKYETLAWAEYDRRCKLEWEKTVRTHELAQGEGKREECDH